MSQVTPPRRGRPPSAKARAKALAAAREILLTEGFGRLTIEAVAAASGTGKPTIYRHWANAQELAMEALIADAPTPEAPEGDPLAALAAQLTRLAEAFATTRGRQITLALASADPDSESQLVRRWIYSGGNNDVVCSIAFWQNPTRPPCKSDRDFGSIWQSPLLCSLCIVERNRARWL